MEVAKPGSLRHFYVAVGSAKAKLDTLIELITALSAAASRSLVICCGSRDVLDTVTAAVRSLTALQLWCLHADMSEREIEAAVQRFRGPSKKDPTKGDEDPAGGLERGGAVIRGRTFIDPGVLGGQDGEDGAVGAEPVPRQKVLLTTDAPLRALSKDAIPLAPTLLINYDIPARKEEYSRRIGSVLGSRSRSGGQRISISFVEAGRVGELRQLEEFAEREVREMPVHVTDIFAAAAARDAGETD